MAKWVQNVQFLFFNDCIFHYNSCVFSVLFFLYIYLLFFQKFKSIYGWPYFFIFIRWLVVLFIYKHSLWATSCASPFLSSCASFKIDAFLGLLQYYCLDVCFNRRTNLNLLDMLFIVVFSPIPTRSLHKARSSL